MKLTALIEKSEDGWFVGQLEEFPEVLSQGKTLSEVKSNLLDALSVLVDANRESVAFNNKGKTVIREQLEVVWNGVILSNTLKSTSVFCTERVVIIPFIKINRIKDNLPLADTENCQICYVRKSASN